MRPPVLVSDLIIEYGYPSTLASKDCSGIALPDFQFPVYGSIHGYEWKQDLYSSCSLIRSAHHLRGLGGLASSSPPLWAWRLGNSVGPLCLWHPGKLSLHLTPLLAMIQQTSYDQGSQNSPWRPNLQPYHAWIPNLKRAPSSNSPLLLPPPRLRKVS